VEEDGIVGGLGDASWAAAMGDRQEHAIKIGMTLRKIIRFRPASESVGSDVLHAPFHDGVELSTNDLVVIESSGLTKMERTACRSGKMVPIRTQ